MTDIYVVFLDECGILLVGGDNGRGCLFIVSLHPMALFAGDRESSFICQLIIVYCICPSPVAEYETECVQSVTDLQVSQDESKAQIELEKTSVEPVQGKVMAILAGSRKNELVHMVPVYAQTARIIKEKMPDVVFISACPDKERAEMLKDLWLSHAPDLSLTIYIGCTHAVIGAADAVLLTSGTIAFETMLLKRPMAVAYKVNPLTALIGRRLLKINMFSLPNLLAKRRIVAEFIQEQCIPEALAQEMLKLLTSDNLLMKNEFLSMHKAMIKNSDEIAAKAVLSLIKKSGIKTVESKDNKAFNGMVEPSFTVPANIAGTDRAARQEPRL